MPVKKKKEIVLHFLEEVDDDKNQILFESPSLWIHVDVLRKYLIKVWLYKIDVEYTNVHSPGQPVVENITDSLCSGHLMPLREIKLENVEIKLLICNVIFV